MSIAITINNPIDDKEEEFCIPFSTESLYYNFWKKGAEELNLDLIPFLEVLDIDKEQWRILKQEIQQMMLWASNNLSSDRRDGIHERVNFVIDTLENVFKRNDVIVSFG